MCSFVITGKIADGMQNAYERLLAMNFKIGIYQHYKGKKYKALLQAKHSETEEDMVVYQMLYGDYSYWVRPLSMFMEMVEQDGKMIPRFRYLENNEGVDD